MLHVSNVLTLSGRRGTGFAAQPDSSVCQGVMPADLSPSVSHLETDKPSVFPLPGEWQVMNKL